MNSTVFGQIGPYRIERPIGQGGMASVFLARDTRVETNDAATEGRPNGLVALKVVHLGSDTDEDAREILASEQRGADLQQRFSAISRYVPKVFDSGFTADYFYIAMEYIVGEDLSQAIHRGPMPWQRAVAITMQLCEFLAEADGFEVVAVAGGMPEVGGSRRVLLHNDLKPRNIRLVNNGGPYGADEIKVLDFGAAKALSLSRKVTRNDFGSTAYLSPECLESGDRDLHSDAWALGVLLYEMVGGRQPFRADDTRRLEQLIRSRRAPESIDGHCPPALAAVVAKLLAPYPADRYSTPAEIRADLARAQTGEDTYALRDGWLARTHDEPPTRRTHDMAPTKRTHGHDEPAKPANGHDEPAKLADGDEPPTRRTHGPGEPATNRLSGHDEPARLANGNDEPAIGSDPVVPPAPARRRFLRLPRLPRFVRIALIVIVGAVALSESCVASRANRLADTVPLQEFAGLATLWPQYESLADRSPLGWGVSRLEDAIARQTMVLAERVMANYRTPMPTVRENQWKAAREALGRAVTLAPGNASLQAALRYCDGHLYRINGEANKTREGHQELAQQQFTDAVVAFREAAALRPGWPDPFLGLARTFIYGLEDVDRGADALRQAEENGHHPGERETTQLADGYRARGEALARTAQSLKGMTQERDYLSRARDAYREALTRYTTVAGYGNAAANIRDTQRRLDRVEGRLSELSRFERWWPWA